HFFTQGVVLCVFLQFFSPVFTVNGDFVHLTSETGKEKRLCLLGTAARNGKKSTFHTGGANAFYQILLEAEEQNDYRKDRQHCHGVGGAPVGNGGGVGEHLEG